MKKLGKSVSVKYFVPMITQDELLMCRSFNEAIGLANPGQSIYKSVRIGRINKVCKFIRIKRRKK